MKNVIISVLVGFIITAHFMIPELTMVEKTASVGIFSWAALCIVERIEDVTERSKKCKKEHCTR